MPCRHLQLLLLLPLLLGARRARAWGFSGPPAPRFAVVPASVAREGKGERGRAGNRAVGRPRQTGGRAGAALFAATRAQLPHTLHSPTIINGTAGQLDALSAQAEGEGFLDRILGTNCFSTAVAELTSDCRRLEPEAKTRLALRLANCQLAVQGGATYPCGRRQSIRECTEALSERAHALFVEFLTHADTCALLDGRDGLRAAVAAAGKTAVLAASHDARRGKPAPSHIPTPTLHIRSMCLHIQNQNFERHTENMLNRLAEGAGFAREQLSAVAKATGKLGADTAALTHKAEAALGMLHEHGELEQESLRLQKKARAEASAYFQTLDAKQTAALELQARGTGGSNSAGGIGVLLLDSAPTEHRRA